MSAKKHHSTVSREGHFPLGPPLLKMNALVSYCKTHWINASTKWHRFPVKGQPHVKLLCQNIGPPPSHSICTQCSQSRKYSDSSSCFLSASCFLPLSLSSKPIYYFSFVSPHLPPSLHHGFVKRASRRHLALLLSILSPCLSLFNL